MAIYKKNYGKGYGKRPLWQWILIYLIVGAVVYYIIYALFVKKSGTSVYSTAPTNSTPGQQQSAPPVQGY